MPTTIELLSPHSQRTKSHAEQFWEAVRIYKLRSTDDKVTSLDLNKSYSWNEVFRTVQDNEVLYKTAARNPFRKLGRFVSRKARIVHPWLRVIPNGFYTSVVCGGLKCILEVRIEQRVICFELV
jgi:hypothetical protein